VVAEVKAAYDWYNNAINSGTIAVLNVTFWNDPRTIRYGQAENLYGYKEIEGFRANARPLDPPRTLSKTVITTYGHDFAVASTLTHRGGLGSGRRKDRGRKTVESYRMLDVDQLAKKGCLRPGWSGTCQWTDGDEIV
jgi:hypothetical protein